MIRTTAKANEIKDISDQWRIHTRCLGEYS